MHTINEVNLQLVNSMFMVTSLPELQQPSWVTTAATEPVGLPGWHGNSCPRAYKN